MDALVRPSALRGSVRAVASKSMAHRLLILSALAGTAGEVDVSTSSQDIEATRQCLQALAKAPGAGKPGSEVVLDCGESGSTLRFLAPVVCALGVRAHMVCHGRLTERPLFPLDEQLQQHGAHIERTGRGWRVSGQLRGGRFTLPGDVSSQYVSGLLLAAPLLNTRTEVLVEAPVQSRPYIDLTIRALELFGARVAREQITENHRHYEAFRADPTKLSAQGPLKVEGDWSNAAFWLAAGSLEQEGLTVTGLDLASPQGDRAVLAALAAFGARIARRGSSARATADTPRAAQMDVSSIPDLVPPLAAVAAAAPGQSRLRNAGRLRLKESDRLSTVCAALAALGGRARVEDNDLVIDGTGRLSGGVVDAANDHRIAMMAAIMATHATGEVVVRGAECVAKSYPAFWQDYAALGGRVRLI